MVYALDIHKPDHETSSPTHFHEAALDYVGRPELAPKMPREGEEGKHLRQIAICPVLHQALEVFTPIGNAAVIAKTERLLGAWSPKQGNLE